MHASVYKLRERLGCAQPTVYPHVTPFLGRSQGKLKNKQGCRAHQHLQGKVGSGCRVRRRSRGHAAQTSDPPADKSWTYARGGFTSTALPMVLSQTKANSKDDSRDTTQYSFNRAPFQMCLRHAQVTRDRAGGYIALCHRIRNGRLNRFWPREPTYTFTGPAAPSFKVQETTFTVNGAREVSATAPGAIRAQPE